MNILPLGLVAFAVLVCCITTSYQEESHGLAQWSTNCQKVTQNLTHWSKSHQNEPHDLTQWARSRQKRFLIFPNLGVHKFIISLALTIDLQDKRAWRSLSGAWNFQWQHSLPLTALKWWNSTYHPAKARSMLDDENLDDTPVDITATFLYALIESYMDNKGMNGRECLQRAICENAQITHVGGVLDQIYRRFLTPERRMEDFYKDAFAMGRKGVDCHRTYFACPRGRSVFDEFVHVDEVPG